MFMFTDLHVYIVFIEGSSVTKGFPFNSQLIQFDKYLPSFSHIQRTATFPPLQLDDMTYKCVFSKHKLGMLCL